MVVYHIQAKASMPLKAQLKIASVMGKKKIPDRKFNALIDLQIAHGCLELKKSDGIYRYNSTAAELQNCKSVQGRCPKENQRPSFCWPDVG